MFKVKDKFLNCTVYASNFVVLLKDASQEQLEHLYHLGHEGIIANKKVKNKPVINLDNEETKSQAE